LTLKSTKIAGTLSEKRMSMNCLIFITMKKKLKFVIVIFCMFTLDQFETQAQVQLRCGSEVGLNFSKMTLEQNRMSIDPSFMNGFNGGLIYEITFKNKFILQSGFLYSTKGSKYTVSGHDLSISPSFIDIPINAMCKYKLGSSKLLLFAGPYFAFGVGGSYEVDGQKSNISYGNGDNKDMKSFDFGLNFGTGIEVKNFQFKVQYGLGLANLAPVTTNGTEMKSTVLGISMAYLMEGK